MTKKREIPANLEEVFINCEISRSKKSRKYVLRYRSEDEASNALGKINGCLGTKYKLSKNKLTEFQLSADSLERIRQTIRDRSKAMEVKEDFVFKAICSDKYCFIRNFMHTVLPGQNFRMPLRPANKRSFTVNGNGAFSRELGVSPLKTSQYSYEQKKDFSQPQAATFGLPSIHSAIYGERRRDALGTIFFSSESYLMTDKLSVKDYGSVSRPEDFDSLALAKEYYHNTSNGEKRFYSVNDLENFRKALDKELRRFNLNEIFVRLRWIPDNTNQVFVGTDTLNARLAAQNYARIIKKYLLQTGLCDENYNVPICFYSGPNNPDLNFKPYSESEQKLDNLLAISCFKNKAVRDQKIKDIDYEFLLALQSNHFEDLLNDINEAKLFFKKIIRNNIFIFSSIMEILEQPLRSKLFDCLVDNLDIQQKDDELLSLVNSLLSIGNGTCNDFDGYCFEILDRVSNLETAQINPYLISDIARSCELLDDHKKIIFNKLLDNPLSLINNKDSGGKTALIYAISNHHSQVAIELLKRGNIDINIQDDNDSTALIYAVKNGNLEVVNQLLECPNVNANHQNKKRYTALTYAVINENVEIVESLLKKDQLETSLIPAFEFALKQRNTKIIALFLQQNKKLPNDKFYKGLGILLNENAAEVDDYQFPEDENYIKENLLKDKAVFSIMRSAHEFLINQNKESMINELFKLITPNKNYDNLLIFLCRYFYNSNAPFILELIKNVESEANTAQKNEAISPYKNQAFYWLYRIYTKFGKTSNTIKYQKEFQRTIVANLQRNKIRLEDCFGVERHLRKDASLYMQSNLLPKKKAYKLLQNKYHVSAEMKIFYSFFIALGTPIIILGLVFMILAPSVGASFILVGLGVTLAFSMTGYFIKSMAAKFSALSKLTEFLEGNSSGKDVYKINSLSEAFSPMKSFLFSLIGNWSPYQKLKQLLHEMAYPYRGINHISDAIIGLGISLKGILHQETKMIHFIYHGCNATRGVAEILIYPIVWVKVLICGLAGVINLAFSKDKANKQEKNLVEAQKILSEPETDVDVNSENIALLNNDSSLNESKTIQKEKVFAIAEKIHNVYKETSLNIENPAHKPDLEKKRWKDLKDTFFYHSENAALNKSLSKDEIENDNTFNKVAQEYLSGIKLSTLAKSRVS